MSRRIRMTVAYDGTRYAGWQRQKNGIAVQQRLEEAFYTLFHETVVGGRFGTYGRRRACLGAGRGSHVGTFDSD